jgi:cytoskeleton protein RodZ
MENPVNETAAIPTPGAVLADARRRNGLSVGDIAAKLRMGIPQVDALEHADYSRLPTGTFLRGFVRSYAKLVGLDPNEVLALLEQTHDAKPKPTIVVPSHNIRFTAPGEQFASPRGRVGLLLIVLVAAVAAGWYWWTFMRQGAQSAQPSPVAAQTNTANPINDAAPAAGSGMGEPGASAAGADQKDPVTGMPQPTGLENASISVQQPATQTPAQPATEPPLQSAPARATQAAPLSATQSASQLPLQSPSQPQPPASQSSMQTASPPPTAARPGTAPQGDASKSSPASVKAAAAGAQARLRFAFSGESWVEVVDGSGRTLASRRYRAGEGEDVSGKPPLAVVIGNAPATHLSVDGIEFDLAPVTRVAVARFTLK